MSLTVVALVLTFAAPDLERAIAHTHDGRFVEALLAAESEPDAARRAEASLYVRHHAGDLTGALSIADAARRAGSSTPWLEEREAFVALSMRDAARARAALDALASRPDGVSAGLASIAAGHARELADLEQTLLARDHGIASATWVLCIAALIAVGVGLGFALTRGRANPSP